MLTLTRKRGQSVVIDCPGGPVEVRVQEIERGKVRLSFDAPRDVKIYRNELLTPPATPENRPVNESGGGKAGEVPPAA